jgi:hypothetical protein
MIHDVDHPGVSSMQRIAEKDEMALHYQNKSVSQQNSVDLMAWELLMNPAYEDLRKCVISNESELQRFRKLLVNSFMATELFDPEPKALCNSRWDQAFSGEGEQTGASLDLKATIVIEHINTRIPCVFYGRNAP